MSKNKKIEIRGKTKIVFDDTPYVLKPKIRRNHPAMVPYLKSRNFYYFPKILEETDQYIKSEYIEDYDVPGDQKILDLVDLMALLHSKTTHYQEVTEDDYKKIYEDLTQNILYLKAYYEDLATLIESKIYPSPGEYLFIRNISKIFASLYFCEQELKEWYSMVKEKREKRVAILHNNLKLEHFRENETPYFISWDKSKIDLPIFDFYKLYQNHALDYDFNKAFREYERNYPLQKEEKKLLFILLSLPDKITFSKNEYENTWKIGQSIDKLYKSEYFISPYYPKKREEDKT